MTYRDTEFIVYSMGDPDSPERHPTSGREVWRGTVSTHKWGPRNAITACVRDQRPPAGRYLVAGDQGGGTSPPGRFNIYEVRYPQAAIKGEDWHFIEGGT